MDINSFSFGMLKPDCLKRGLEHKSFDLIKESGLSIFAEDKIMLDDNSIDIIYHNLKNAEFFKEMNIFLKSHYVIVFIAFGEDAVRTLNRVVGYTDPKLAKPNTLRYLGTDIRNNIAHSASNYEEVLKSANHFFKIIDLPNPYLKMP